MVSRLISGPPINQPKSPPALAKAGTPSLGEGKSEKTWKKPAITDNSSQNPSANLDESRMEDGCRKRNIEYANKTTGRPKLTKPKKSPNVNWCKTMAQFSLLRNHAKAHHLVFLQPESLC
jgi:hypothetical protein